MFTQREERMPASGRPPREGGGERGHVTCQSADGDTGGSAASVDAGHVKMCVLVSEDEEPTRQSGLCLADADDDDDEAYKKNGGEGSASVGEEGGGSVITARAMQETGGKAGTMR